MIIVYSPEGGDKQQWEFAPGKVRSTEVERIEKRYPGGDDVGYWPTFLADVNKGSVTARRVLLWHLIRRDHPTLRWEDTPDFYADELSVVMSLTELVEIRDRVSRDKAIDAEIREQAIDALTAQIEEIEQGSDGDPGDAEGKAM